MDAPDAPDLDAAIVARAAELGLGRPEPPEAAGHYVYGVVRSGAQVPRDLPGVIPGAPVRLIESRGLAALVSDVPLAEFDEDGLRRNVADVAWLEAMERAHERVLAAALAETAVVPLRLCTVVATEVEVIEMLSRDHGVLLDALARLADCAEWSVKAFAGRTAIEREAARRSARAAADEVEEAPVGIDWGWEIHADLALFAEEALQNPLQAPEVSGRHGEMLMNGVYLVDDEQASAFRSVARELSERLGWRGVEIVLSGPAPAYNFVKSSIEAAR